MDEADIISVTELDFEIQVLAYSERLPVIVNFWAPWDDTCKRTTEKLESLAFEYPGRFRLANLDVDQNPQITSRYSIHTVPTIKTFQNGVITHQLKGLQTHLQLTEFVKKIAPGPENLLLEKAANYLSMGDYHGTEETCLEILDLVPEHSGAKLILSKSLIRQGEYLEALTILNHFPASLEYQAAEKLIPLVEGLVSDVDPGAEHQNPLDPIYYRSLDLVKRHNIQAALDGLISLLKKDKSYRGGAAKSTILGIFELLGDRDPLVIEYRDQLANALF
jgi:putative thioredoxin